MFAGLVVATVIAFFWPNTYVSQATLRIAPRATNIIPSEAGSRMGQRLSDMQNQVFSRTTLQSIIENPALELYQREQKTEPMEDVVAQMRKDIDVRMVGSPILAGDGQPTASAFTIQFRYSDRIKAQRVAAELSTRFIESSRRLESQQHRTTTSIVDDILKADKARLDDLERQIAQFAAENQGKLPEDSQSNQQILSSQLLQVSEWTSQLRNDRDAKASLEARLKTQLAQKDLYEGRVYESKDAPAGRAAEPVNPQYAQVLNDLQKVDNQIANLKGMVGENNPQMKGLRIERATLAQRKGDLERDDERTKANGPPAPPPATVQTLNPQAQGMLVSINGKSTRAGRRLRRWGRTSVQVSALLEEAKRKLEAYQARIDAGPRSGQEYARLTRERQLVLDQYEQDTKKKSLTDADEAVLANSADESLEVMDQASLPEQPVEPKRPLYAAFGAAAGLMVGLMLAGAKEVKDTSLKNLKDVRAYTNVPVLSSVPLLENALLVRKKRRLYWIAWAATLLMGFWRWARLCITTMRRAGRVIEECR